MTLQFCLNLAYPSLSVTITILPFIYCILDLLTSSVSIFVSDVAPLLNTSLNIRGQWILIIGNNKVFLKHDINTLMMYECC